MTTVPPRVAAASVRRLDAGPTAGTQAPRAVAPTVLVVPDVVPVQADAVARRLRRPEHAFASVRSELRPLSSR